MKRRFVTLDVFTDRRSAGNPLAVVLDAADLDTAAMQAIAGRAVVATEAACETAFARAPWSKFGVCASA